MSEDDDDRKLPSIQNRLIGAAVEIDQDDPLEDRLPAQPVLSGGATAQPARGARFRASLSKRVYPAMESRGVVGWLRDGSSNRSPPARSRALPFDPHQQPSRENAQPLRGQSAAVAPSSWNASGLNDQRRQHLQSLFKREMKALAACRMTLGFTVGTRGRHRSTRSPYERIQGMDGDGAKPAQPLWPDLSRTLAEISG
jgi:hypothetical protein